MPRKMPKKSLPPAALAGEEFGKLSMEIDGPKRDILFRQLAILFAYQGTCRNGKIEARNIRFNGKSKDAIAFRRSKRIFGRLLKKASKGKRVEFSHSLSALLMENVRMRMQVLKKEEEYFK